MPEAELPQTQARRLALAYLAVLGAGDARDGDQRLVWADLESFCHAHRPTPEKTTSLQLDPNAMFLNEGKRLVWMRARGMLIRAMAEPKPPKILKQRRQPNQ